jgi:predicted CoA-substrate-specific enzyme activase
MKVHLGIDIGAVSLTAAALVEPVGEGGFPLDQFAPAGTVASANLHLSPYRRTRGRPIESATALLEEVVAAVGQEQVASVCFTGSAGRLLADRVSAPSINEFKAIALGLAGLGIEARTVFEMGGQSSKYLLLEPSASGYSIVDYATNGDCAAGTGSFIDQQAGRLRLAVEEVGRIALSAGRTAQVAGRCSVFAKSDMIHAQQKGYTPSEVLAGLCEAVARNFRMAVVRSHPVVPPVAFIGGLAANAAVAAALPRAFDLGAGDFSVVRAHAHVLAVGAALAARQAATGQHRPGGTGGQGGLTRQMRRLRESSDTAHGQFPTAEPLALDRVVLLRDRVEPYQLPFGTEKIDAYLGIDVGSVSTNVVLIDPEGSVIKDIYVRTLGRPIEVVTECLREIAEEFGQRVVIRGAATTGSGRELIGELVGADTVNDEITAHKTGAMFIGQRMLNGRVPDTIFEVGGQDSKFISLQDGVVVDFTMNEACAAGTGSFLEERAEELDIAIINEFAELALASTAPIRLGERCTVFMERDVNDYLQRGANKRDLVAGLAYSVVYNYINRVVRGRRIGECIFFQGGTAYNDAVAAAFTAVLGKEVIVPPYNGVIGAIGAALLARDKMTSPEAAIGAAAADRPLGRYVSALENSPPKARSRFRGYDLAKVRYGLREFICQGCSNRCIIQEFDVEGEKTYWGDKCSDRYRKRRKSALRPVIEDLFGYRERLLNDGSALPAAAGAPAVGIPRAMFAMDFLPFWRTFWGHCGFRVVVSDPTNRQMVAAGTAHVVAEPCFPVIVAHGHVAALLESGVDWLFVPNVVSAESNWKHTESYLCPWNQTLPFVLRRVPAFERHLEKFLTPCLPFRKGPEAVARAMRQLCRPLGVRGGRVDAALAAAYRAQQEFRSALLSAGAAALETLRRTGQPGIVFIGRPYNVHDAGVNLSVARKLRDYYGINCIPIDFLDTAGVDIRPINENMYWDYGRRLIAAAGVVGKNPNLHIIHITNFKCGPDSFLKHFIRTASGKPFLGLQFDGHSNDAGMLTRCEAYLDSKGILRPWKKASSAEDAAVLSG